MKAVALSLSLLAGSAFAQAVATASTAPITTPTAANDTAIWIHPTNVGQSLVYGTDQFGTGLSAYFLDGGLAELINIGPTRAVDVRYGVKIGARLTDVVLAVNTNGDFRLHAVDPDGGRLSAIDTAATNSGSNANAAALSFNPVDRTLMIFVSDFAGNLRHFRAVDDGLGRLAVTLQRTIALGNSVEGIAADDRAQRLFVTIANRGLFTLAVANGGSIVPSLVDSSDAGRLGGAKGVALYFTAGGGYIIASASQTSRFPVYSLATGFPFVTSFTIVADGGMKGATNTQGIEVTPLSLGAPFTKGLFVAHDALNTNYKLVGWDDIAGVTTPVLTVDTRVDPRMPLVDAGTPDAGTKCVVPMVTDGGDGGELDGGDAGDCVSGAGGGGGSGAGGGTSGSGGGTSSGSGGGITGGSGGGAPPEEPKGCGCGNAGLLVPLAALAWLIRRRRAQG